MRRDAHLADRERRPLVIARLDEPVADDIGVVAAAKDAIARGADLVELSAAGVSTAVCDALDRIDVGYVVCVSGTDPRSDPVYRRAVALHLDGSWVDPGGIRSARVPVLSTDPALVGPGDGLVVDPDHLATLADRPDGAGGIVDLTMIGQRAELAAVVTLALEFGATGFLTAAPSPVRRAAYVIRAVELAE